MCIRDRGNSAARAGVARAGSPSSTPPNSANRSSRVVNSPCLGSTSVTAAVRMARISDSMDLPCRAARTRSRSRTASSKSRMLTAAITPPRLLAMLAVQHADGDRVVGSSRPRRVVLLVDVPLSEQVALPSVLDSSRTPRTAFGGSAVPRVEDRAPRRRLRQPAGLLVRVTLRYVAVDVVPALPDEGVVGRAVRHLMSDCRLTSGREAAADG